MTLGRGTRPAVWFPAIRAGTGVDVFTRRLCRGLNERGVRAEITWLPCRAEYMPWSVPVPDPPTWANIVHVNTWLHGRFIPDGVPVLSTSHLCVHDAALGPYKGVLQSLYHRFWVRSLEKNMLDRSARVVAVSHYTAEKTELEFGLREVAVIHNGVQGGCLDDVAVRESTPRAFRLLYVGNWSTRKGSDLVPSIMESLGPEFQLWYTADARGADRKFTLPESCRCLGRLNQIELQRVYRQVDALLFPTRLEGFGLVAAEAMAAGVPVIATRCSSLPEIVVDGRTGILCEPDDVAAFANAARRLARDGAERRRMGTKAQERAHTIFSEDRWVEGYISQYQDML